MTTVEEIADLWDECRSKWGLGGWELRFSNQKRKLGYCKPQRKIISLSLAYMETNPIAVIRDTLLHEVAHALHYIETGSTGHGRRWKEIAVEVGCEPRRCADLNGTNLPRGKYMGICPECGKSTPFYRQVHREYSCRFCTESYDPRYKLDIITVDEYKTRKSTD